MNARVIDLFAGIGWAEGLRSLGLHEVGIDIDPAACATRIAAGHETIQADVTTLEPGAFPADGLIASPPCQDWSTAGTMLRRDGRTGDLVDVVPRWALAIRPRWIVCEQVPPALEVWHEHGHTYRDAGYRTWVGLIDTSGYGVPQNRVRAILLASIDGQPRPPAVTHGADPLFGDLEPFVTLADVVGLEPGWRYDSGQNSRAAGGGTERYIRSCDRPAGTITTKTTRQWVLHGPNRDRRKLTTADALALQTFRRDLPLVGTAEQQHRIIGNAVPPLLAEVLVRAVAGLSLEERVA